MREVTQFSLENHAGEYETWPLRSRLICGKRLLPLTLPGFSLLRQYSTIDGYLFVTDYDCQFEEKTNFILVNKDYDRILCERGIGGPYTSCLLDDLSWHDERHFIAMISGEHIFFSIRSFSIPYLYPKLVYSNRQPSNWAPPQDAFM